jgi:NAD(P)-dependent dehydrogenase (short-subunit alcohol dehydrogenase family)
MAALQNTVAALAGAETPLFAGCGAALAEAGFRLAQLEPDGAAESVFASIAAELGPVTCLVNSASTLGTDTALTVTEALLSRHLAANTVRPALLAQAFAKALPEDAEGLIINLADLALGEPAPAPFAAVLSQHALWILTRQLAQALAPRIRVNLIAPGPVLAALAAPPISPQERTRRVGEAVHYLLGAAAVTGQMIALDLGPSLHP